jgi:hypothetical protein
MLCADCNKPIAANDQTATGPSGKIHLACFKRGTMRGESIDLLSLLDKIQALERRVQQLESVTERHDRNIDFRIGGQS